MKKLEGRISILFDRDRGLTIELEDEPSGTSIKCTLDKDQAMSAMSRLAYTPCTIEYPDDLQLIGKTRDTKRAFIDIEDDYYNKRDSQFIAEECERQGLLVDGFELFSDGTTSQQNTRGKHEVVLRRYLDTKEQQND